MSSLFQTAIFQTAIFQPLVAASLIAGFAVAPALAAAGTADDAPGATPAVMMKKPMVAGDNIRDNSACNTTGIALAGIDVVSYHAPTGPLMGSSRFVQQHKGLSYHFLSQSNLDAFKKAPDKYLPSYLGWCATSLADGALTCPNPLNYKLENGRLLLFETTGFTNGQVLWNSDPADYQRRADSNRDRYLSKGSERGTNEH